jgi:hypothetical protein
MVSAEPRTRGTPALAPAARGRALVVGAASDPAEREADQAAADVLSEEGRRPRLRSAPGDGDPVAGSASAASIAQLRGAGAPLPGRDRGFFEQRFGRDFGSVRVHSDAAAAATAREIGAQAFTTGNDIFFGAGHYAPGTQEGRSLLAHELAHVVQQSQVVRRKCAACGGRDGGSGQSCASCAEEDLELPIQRRAEGASPVARGPAIVEDGLDAGVGQMTRSAFMSQLRSSLTGLCNAELAAAGRSADDCPYLQNWLDYYSARPAPALMRAIRLYAGAVADADAASLMDAVHGRVRSAVRTWVAGGGTSGVPEGVEAMPPGAPAEGGAPALQTKEQPGAAAAARSPGAIQAQLGPGRPLESHVRSRMESAFGGSFGHVRLHTDAVAARINSNLAARAFTVGGDIAFADGEYRPGTIAGDLLLAHELAHTRQQAGKGGPAAAFGATDHAAEQAADRAALAMLLDERADAGRLGGLRLQRCAAAPAVPLVVEGLAVGGTAAAATTGTGITVTTVLGTAAVATSVTMLESDSGSLTREYTQTQAEAEATTKAEAEAVEEDYGPRCPQMPRCPHLGGSIDSNACADYVSANPFPGCDYYVGGKNFDAVSADMTTLYEMKAWDYSNYDYRRRRIALFAMSLDVYREMAIAARCGFRYVLVVTDPQMEADVRALMPGVPTEIANC